MPDAQHYVLGNWKMNTSMDEARNLFGELPSGLPGVQVGVASPYPWLVPLATEYSNHTAWLGAQDVSAHESGAYTGEVSMNMLRPWCDFVLIGHSESRQYHPVPAGHLARKVERVLQAERVAVVCVGEDLAQRQAGNATSIVHTQLADALDDLAVIPESRLLIAYEPVWAIGTGIAATVDDAAAMANDISTWLKENPVTNSAHIPILYGGSVTPENAASIMAQSGIDGLLVGGASLDSSKFRTICEAATG